MTVLLVLATFAVFVFIDWLAQRHVQQPVQTVRVPSPPPVEPVWVAGYLTPAELHYHRGHTWARPIDSDTVAVGIDDFARRLLGSAKSVRLPAVGDWVRQGDPSFTVAVDGRAADLVSPVEGQVLSVNPELASRPSLTTTDPYGRGWLATIRVPRLAADLRNLLFGGLSRRFMEEARSELDHRLMAFSGSVLQDGGEALADFGERLSEPEWRRLVNDFLLT